MNLSVFTYLQRKGIEMNGSFVKRIVKSILDSGGDLDDPCPHCGWRISL